VLSVLILALSVAKTYTEFTEALRAQRCTDFTVSGPAVAALVLSYG
jgi:hypothetical protein